jgi:hypothetical protein
MAALPFICHEELLLQDPELCFRLKFLFYKSKETALLVYAEKRARSVIAV